MADYLTWSPAMMPGGSYDQSQSEAAALQNIASSKSRLGNMAGQAVYGQGLLEHEKELRKQAAAEAKRRFDAQGVTPSREQWVEEAERIFVEHKERLSGEVAGLSHATAQVAQKGAGQFPWEAYATQEQRASLEQGKSFGLTEEQLQAQLLKQAKTAEDVNAIMSGNLTPEQQALRENLSATTYRTVPKTPSWYEAPLHRLMQPVVAVEGGLATAQREALAATKDIPTEYPEKKSAYAAVRNKVMETLLTPAASATEFALNLGQLWEGAKQVVGQGDDPNFHWRSLGDAIDTLTQGGQVTGVPVKGMAERLVENPGLLGDIVGGLFSGMKEGWNADDPQTVGYAASAEAIRKAYMQKAAQQAISELGEYAPREYKVARAQELLEAAVEDDLMKSGIKDPAALSFGLSFALDPLNLLGPAGKALRVAGTAAKGVKGGRAAVGALRGGVAGGVLGGVPGALAGAATGGAAGAKWTQIAGPVGRALRPIAYRSELWEAPEETASLLRLGEARATQLGREAGPAAAEQIKVLEKLNPEQQQRFAQIVEGESELGQIFNPDRTQRVFAEQVPEELREAFKAHEKLLDLHGDLRTSTGIGRAFNPETGVLEEEKFVQSYLPRKGQKSTIAQEVARAPSKKKGRAQLLPGSAKERELETYLGELSPGQRWASEFRESLPKAVAAKELRNIAQTLKSKGNITLLLEKAPYDSKAVQARLAKLQEISGVEWVSLDDITSKRFGGTGNVFRRLTETPGKIKTGTQITLMPRYAAERIADIVPLVEDVRPIKKAIDSFMNDFVRPTQGIWRLGHTAVVPGFSARNMVSGVSLGALGLGWRAANPKLQADALFASVMGAASKNPKAFKAMTKIPITLRDGTKVNLAEVWKAFQSTGLASQLEARFAMESIPAVGKQGVGKAVSKRLKQGQRAMEKAAAFGELPGIQYASPMFMARATENYQHFVTFLGALDNLTDEGIAKALDFSSKWSANYARLGTAEKAIFRDVFKFYAWNRFAGSMLLHTLVEDPKKLANFMKGRRFVEEEFGPPGGTPTPEAQPAWIRGRAVIAPKGLQPKALSDIRGLSDNQYALMMMEDPISMGMEPLGTLTQRPGAAKIAEQFSPLLVALAEAATGRDLRTGRELKQPMWPEALSWSNKKNRKLPAGFNDARITHIITSPIERPTEALQNLIQLYLDAGRPGDAAKLMLRYKAERDFAGMNRALGMLPNVDVEDVGVPGAIPGFALYEQNMDEELSRSSSRAFE